MRTFVPDRTCWSLLLTVLAIRLRNKPTYNKLRVLIINKNVRKSLARNNGNKNPIWSWNDSYVEKDSAEEHLRSLRSEKSITIEMVDSNGNVKCIIHQ